MTYKPVIFSLNMKSAGKVVPELCHDTVMGSEAEVFSSFVLCPLCPHGCKGAAIAPNLLTSHKAISNSSF